MATCDPNTTIAPCWACRSEKEILAGVVSLLCDISAGGGGGGGSGWLIGEGAPDSGSGSDGDFYLNTLTGDVYSKSSGSWSIVGRIFGPGGDALGGQIYDFLAVISKETDTYLTQNSDTGKIKEFEKASPFTVTLHKTAPIGTNICWAQTGDGQITFSPQVGASMVNYNNHNKAAGKYASGSLYVRANSDGSSAVWLFSGVTTV
jgi:hypothetical protein